MLINSHLPEIKYPVWVAGGALKNIFEYIPAIKEADRVAVVTDREVFALHFNTLLEQFNHNNIPHHTITVEGTEAGKTLDSVSTIIDRLNDLAFTRDDVLLAFGGGSILDLTAFASSVYLGGLDYWHLPTTLPAMIDSAVSKNCMLNFRSSKDLITLKTCPQGVLIDPDVLQTLTPKQMANGYVRMIQYGYLHNPDLVKMLEAKSQDLCELIKVSINSKFALMNEDPFLLSFGQPISDAIEGHFRFLKYLHGEALALGMLASSPSEDLAALLETYQLPVSVEGVTKETLIRRAAKICSLQGHQYRFVKALNPGQVQIETIERHDFEKVLTGMVEVIANKD